MVGNKAAAPADAVLVGAGIMSATLAILLKELQPSLRVEIVEELDGAALESSNAWNNAGTGHAAIAVMRAQRGVALLEIGDPVGAVHEAHMRHRMDERFG